MTTPDKLKQAIELLAQVAKEITPASTESAGAVCLFDLPPSADRQPIPYAQIILHYNETCISLPKCSQISEARRSVIRARFMESKRPDDALLTFFQRVEESDFLTGRISSFRASFDWIMKPANFIKIQEGNYDNKDGQYVKTKALTSADHEKGF